MRQQMVRYAPILLLLIAVPCWSQTITTGRAQTSGLCSPAITGSHNTFAINCGIGKDQGEMLLKIINKILSNQTDLKGFGDTLDEILKGVNDIRQSFAEQDVPHIQPELVIDSVGSDSVKFHVSVLNISNTSLTDVRMNQMASVVRGIGHMLPVTAKLPSRGRVSVPGTDSIGLFRARQLSLVFTFYKKVNGVITEFFSSYSFILPEGPLAPGVVDPRKFFESTGGILKNARAASLDDLYITLSDTFAGMSTGTIEFWTTETRHGGQPNYISIENDTRSFLYDPVTHIARFRSAPGSDPLVLAFEPRDRHMVAFAWDEAGPSLISVDGKSATRHPSQ